MQPSSKLHSKVFQYVLHRNSQISFGRLTIGPSICREAGSFSSNIICTVQDMEENIWLDQRLKGRNHGREEETHTALQLSQDSLKHTFRHVLVLGDFCAVF